MRPALWRISDCSETLRGIFMVNKISRRWSLRGLLLEGRLIDRRIRRGWKNYLFQCGLSTLALLIIFLVVDVVLRAAIVVAIASTAFIVFVIPHSAASSPQRVIGGQVVAVIVGTAFSALYLIPVFGELAEGSLTSPGISSPRYRSA